MPQKSWSAKDERQYEHIKENEREKEGRSKGRVKQIAAVTVNKPRSKEGRTRKPRGHRSIPET
jgi:hypothetical protein